MRSFERRVKEETRLILNRQAMGSRLANKEKIEKKISEVDRLYEIQAQLTTAINLPMTAQFPPDLGS